MKLFKLLWTRYQRTMIILLIAIVGSFAITTITQIKDWNEVKTYMTSQEFATDFHKHPTDFIISTNAENTIPNIPLETVIKKGTSFWQPANERQSFAYKSHSLNTSQSAINQHFQIIVLVMIFTLIGIFGSLSLDNSTHFNGLLLSSKYTRKQILAMKMVLLVGGPILFTLIGELVYYAIVYASVPSTYLNFANQDLSVIGIVNMFFGFLILAMLLFVTTGVIGSTFWSGALYVCFILSGIVFSGATINYGTKIGHHFMTETQFRALTEHVSTFMSSWAGTAMLVIVALGLTIWAFYLFKKLSLERSAQFVLFENLRWPLWWFTLLYTSYAIGGGLLTASAGAVIWGVIAIIAINVMMYFLIFKPQSLRHPIKSIQ